MNPTIIEFTIGNLNLALRWYGVLVMAGIIFSAWLTTVEIKRRKEDPEWVWDMLIWLVLGGIIGARIWYVINATLGGSTYYTDNLIRIIMIPEGGLHYYGAMVGGAIALLIYCKVRKLDVWVFIDSIAPSLLLGQALARPGNFINQELFGQPTSMPWGIKIDAPFRIGEWRDIIAYPVETTRFHPAFAYEMIWNIITGCLMLWLGRKYAEKFKPGAMFGLWLLLAGVGRVIIETWRPDQPVIPGTGLSYTRLVAILMTIAGLLALAYLYHFIKPSFMKAPREKYFISDGYPQPDSGKKAPAKSSSKKSGSSKKSSKKKKKK